MKKLIVLLMLLFSVKAFSQFGEIDTLNVTLSTSAYTRAYIGSGYKSISIHNTSINTLKIGFSKIYTKKTDTSNVYSLFAGNRMTFHNRVNDTIYLYNGLASVMNIILDYGEGNDYDLYSTDANGNVKISQSGTTLNYQNSDTLGLWVDTLKLGTTFSSNSCSGWVNPYDTIKASYNSNMTNFVIVLPFETLFYPATNTVSYPNLYIVHFATGGNTANNCIVRKYFKKD